MKRLQQSKYGSGVEASAIQCLAPYQHISDGFYTWECGNCGSEHSSRTCGWPINGEVEDCGTCGRLNLLVCTNVEEINVQRTLAWQESDERKELERLREVKRLNADDLVQVSRNIYAKMEAAIRDGLK